MMNAFVTLPFLPDDINRGMCQGGDVMRPPTHSGDVPLHPETRRPQPLVLGSWGRILRWFLQLAKCLRVLYIAGRPSLALYFCGELGHPSLKFGLFSHRLRKVWMYWMAYLILYVNRLFFIRNTLKSYLLTFKVMNHRSLSLIFLTWSLSTSILTPVLLLRINPVINVKFCSYSTRVWGLSQEANSRQCYWLPFWLN